MKIIDVEKFPAEVRRQVEEYRQEQQNIQAQLAAADLMALVDLERATELTFEILARSKELNKKVTALASDTHDWAEAIRTTPGGGAC